MLYALQNGKQKEILVYIEQNQRAYNHEGEGRTKFGKNLLEKYLPKSFEILYIGKRSDDRARSRWIEGPVLSVCSVWVTGKVTYS